MTSTQLPRSATGLPRPTVPALPPTATALPRGAVEYSKVSGNCHDTATPAAVRGSGYCHANALPLGRGVFGSENAAAGNGSGDGRRDSERGVGRGGLRHAQGCPAPATSADGSAPAAATLDVLGALALFARLDETAAPIVEVRR